MIGVAGNTPTASRALSASDSADATGSATTLAAACGGDDKAAIAELQKADQEDPFVLALMAQAHEKLQEDAKAKELYRKILGVTSHTSANAYARPLAVEKLKAKS